MRILIFSRPLLLSFSLLGIVGQPCFAQSAATNPPSFSLQVANSEYLLGAGDRIKIDVFNVPEWSGAQTILPDGTVTLPVVGQVSLADKSLAEAGATLQQLLGAYLKKNIVTVQLEQQRPLNIVVSGEINRPGPYTLTGSSATTRPNVSAALHEAGGLKDGADVRNVVLVRRIPGHGSQERKLDLWSLLSSGDVRQDPLLRDGDSIFIPRSQEKLGFDEDLVASSSLSPATIHVQIIGEVRNPGTKELPSNTSFTQALGSSGGLTDQADPNSVIFIRVKPDGTLIRRDLRAVLEQARDPQHNPVLRNGDIIAVQRSLGGGILQLLTSLPGVALLLNLFR
jgi:polysaccharide biosynthesis/export protein